RRGDARLRLGARVQAARHPRRHRVLLDGADGPDHARDLLRERPRARRRHPALRQPWPRLGGLLPRRRDHRDALRKRRVRAARRACERPARARERRPDPRDVHARGARLDKLRGRVRNPLGRLPARLGLCGGRRGRDRARRDVRAPADLGDPPRPPRERAARVRRPRRRRARLRAAARRDPRGALRLARARHRALVPARPADLVHRRAGARSVIQTPHVDWLARSPTPALLGAAAIALLGAVTVPRQALRAFSVAVTAVGFVVSAVFAAILFDRSPDPTILLSEGMTRDQLGALAAIILALIGLVVVLVSRGDGRKDHVGEYYALLTASAAGMVFFVSASSLMTMFLSLEWFSISLYVLCALDTHRRESLEAGLKYLIIGSFGSGVLLFGCALVYGSTGELGFSAIKEATGADDPLFMTGMAMILAGLAFKVSAAPFHMWTPDVYQGAPTSVTAFMAGATKVAALVLTLRILVTAFPEQAEIWSIA